MDIISIEQCLKQINNDVKTKINSKQDELLGMSPFKCLHERLGDREFRKRLLRHLGSKENKYFLSCIKEYSPYLLKRVKEAEVETMDRKLTFLFLRQIGLLYKLDERIHTQAYVIPVEIVESYFELFFKQEKFDIDRKSAPMTRKYMYFLMELIMFLKEQAIKKSQSFERLKERISKKVNWSMLLRFIENVGLVEKRHGKFVVKNMHCDIFFRQSDKEIKHALALFCLNELIKSSLNKSLLIWAIFHQPYEMIKLKQIVQYLEKNNQDVDKDFYEAIEQLLGLEIIAVTEDDVIFCSNDHSGEHQQGMEVAIGQFLVPVYISNDAMWSFRCWGMFQEWEAMVQVVLSEASFRQALTAGYDLGGLLKFLSEFFPETTIKVWQRSFQQWLKTGQPIVKKGNLTLYFVTEPLHVNYIEEHWSAWWEKTTKGIIIEKEFEGSFEQLLQKLAHNVIEQKTEEVIVPKESFQLSIINEFPEASSVIPEVERLPKQWFKLTAYDEKTMQRIVKQAIVLQICLQIEKTNHEIIKLFPLKLTINNGCYEVNCKDNRKISFKQFKKIAIVHPLFERAPIT